MTTTVLVTGADGFVGKATCPALRGAGHHVRCAVRTLRGDQGRSGDTLAIGDIGHVQDWQPALEGVDVIVHLAGRAHVMASVGASDAAAAYQLTNVTATERLAQAAAQAGVRRLVFVSSIKVNGEATAARPFRESDPARPEDEYGRSKWGAEQRLRAIAAETGLEFVIVRPPLVYGPGVKGNLARLMQVLERGTPLPFGRIDNRRSLVGVTNLADAICACVSNPQAKGETFLVSDGDDVSTPALIRAIAVALHCPARLVPVPAWILGLAAVTTRSPALRRLTGSLQVDSTRIRCRLGWRPPRSFEQEIEAMVASHRGYAESGRTDPL